MVVLFIFMCIVLLLFAAVPGVNVVVACVGDVNAVVVADDEDGDAGGNVVVRVADRVVCRGVVGSHGGVDGVVVGCVVYVCVGLWCCWRCCCRRCC